MNVGEVVRFAWQGVTANKSRSALTMLGILIGVSSVIILISVGTGARASITDTINSLGSNTLTITGEADTTEPTELPGLGGGEPSAEPSTAAAGSGTAADDDATQIRKATLTLADAEALDDRERAPDVLAVAPVVSPSGVTATYGSASHPVGTTNGTTVSYLGIQDDTVSAGRLFTDLDEVAHARVVLVGATVARDLAGGDGSALLDRAIQLDGKPFTVIGLLTEKGSAGPLDQDDRVLAPVTSVQDTLFGYGSISSISVQATSAETVGAAQSQVELVLDGLHGTRAGDRSYTISSSSATLDAANTITSLLTSLLAAVAAISLLVGGIGVMNIMLVTVTERTREIGVRKAIGARRGDIVAQFVLEAVLLSTFGGLVGVIIGVGVSQLRILGFQLVVAPYSVVLSFCFSVAIGLFFGLYPARRAASLRPIEALRYE